MQKENGFGRRVVSSFANDRHKKKYNKFHIILTIICIAVSMTIYLQGCTIHVRPTKAILHCERVNDYEIVCKNE
jgi:hypothetical protein